MSDWGSPVGVAVVTALSDDGEVAYVRFATGFVNAVSNDIVGAEVGDVLAIWERHVEFAPEGVWSKNEWVGAVRLRTEEDTVIDGPGGLRLVPTRADVAYEAGNTVLADENGVVRLLTPDSLRWIDLTTPDDELARSFEVPDGENVPTLEDFGGLQDVVEQVLRHVELPLGPAAG